MNNKKRNNLSDDTNVKYAKSEKISLVTGNQVRQFYADTDRDSFKVERSRLFRNNPSPQHHYRYVPESRAFKIKSKKSNLFKIKSKNKKILSYCLIYIILFTCAIILLYLIYTPKQMNLFGFYSNNNLRLKFYRFVLGTNGTTTITPKIITTTEPTIFLSTSTILSSTIKSSSVTQSPTSTTIKSNYKKQFKIESSTTTIKTISESHKPISTSTTSSPVEYNKISDKQYKIEDLENKQLTTCIPVILNVTESSINKKLKLDTISTFSTMKPINDKTTIKSIIIDALKKISTTTTTTTSTTTQPPPALPKDNSTETIEFNEKFQYSSTQNSTDKNETTEDETVVDNGVLPTEEELEEERKSQQESKQKIEKFFGIDPKTGEEKEDHRKNFMNGLDKPIIKSRSSNSENDPIQLSKQIGNNRWFLSGNQQFGNRESINKQIRKEDEFKYHPMLKLIYRECYGGCN